jgi:hypothetical protein
VDADDRFGPRLYPELLIDALQMFLDRPRTDAERQTNFLIRQAVLEPTQHRLFSL